MAMAQAVTNHFDVLVVCPSKAELDVTKAVFEYKTGRKFESSPHFPRDVLVCEEWNSSSMTVAMVSQRQPGGEECRKLVQTMSSWMTARLVAMTGICAGKEDKSFHVEHGSVVVAKTAKTTNPGLGTKKSSSTLHESVPFPDVISLDSEALIKSIEGLASESSEVWRRFIPKEYECPSPRYAKELILQELDKGKLEKETLLTRLLQSKESLAVTEKTWNRILDQMLNKGGPPWVKEERTTYKISTKGKEHKEDASKAFLREYVPKVLVDCIASPLAPADVVDDLQHLKLHMTTNKVSGVDLEAYYLMDEVKTRFESSLSVVMKGLSSDYSGQCVELDCFQKHAASAAAAALRYLIEQRTFLAKSKN